MNISSLRQIGAAVAVTVALAATVNASAPAGRYTYTATSVTVVDTKTGLTWQRAFAAPMSWVNAKVYCASASTSTTLGSPGWRVPTMKELQSLVDYSRTSTPAIDQTAFPATPPNYFWSSSLGLGGASYNALVVLFYDGSSGGLDSTANSGEVANVRCVR